MSDLKVRPTKLNENRSSGRKKINSGNRVGQAKGLHNGVMDDGTHSRDLVVRARGINTVGEKDDEKLAVRVDPDRTATKAQMAETPRRKVAAAGGIRRGDHPSKRARVGRETLPRGELRDRRASQ